MKKSKLTAAIALMVASLLLILTSCGKTAEENPLDAGAYDDQGHFEQLNWFPKAAMNKVDDTKWLDEGSFRHYTGKEYKSHIGIDVSSNQDVINWDKVKAQGIDFVIVRAGYRTYGSGVIKADELCYWNLKEAERVGIKKGVYFFSQAVDEAEARQEADFVLDTVSRFDLELPIYYDTEEINYDNARTDDISGDQHTKNYLAFYKKIEEAGFKCGIYGNQMWLCNKLDYQRLNGHDIWLAKYTEELNYPYDITMWQYSDQGKVEGIGPAVDMDVMLE